MNVEDKISKTYDSLMKHIETLPLSEDAKGHISFNILIDFFDSWQIDDKSKEYKLEIIEHENGEHELIPTNMNYGIRNLRQLKWYVDEFKEFLKKIKIQYFEKMSDKLRSERSITKSIDFVVKKLDEINKKKIEDEINGNSTINEKPTLFEFFLKNERDYLLSLKTVDNKNRLMNHIIESCAQLQGLFKILKDDENCRNTFIANTLNNRFSSWKAKDQSLWGSSEKGKQSGEIDILIENEKNEKTAIIEFLNLHSVSTREITLHVNKIFKYDPNGLSTKFIGVYYRGINKTFGSFWERYIKKVKELENDYELKEFKDITNLASQYSEIRVGLAIHDRNNEKNGIYHIAINLGKEIHSRRDLQSRRIFI